MLPKIIQRDKVLVKQSSKTNKCVSQFDPTPHMVTDVQGSRYVLVADNDHNNAHTIFRHISDIKLYKLYQHPQRYRPPTPTQSIHKYSSLNNTPANPAFNDTASLYTNPFGLDHTSYNKTTTIPISRPPNTNILQMREVDMISGTLHYPQNMPTLSLIYQGDESETQIEIRDWCCIQSYLPFTKSFP